MFNFWCLYLWHSYFQSSTPQTSLQEHGTRICHALCQQLHHTYLNIYDLSLTADGYSACHSIPNTICSQTPSTISHAEPVQSCVLRHMTGSQYLASNPSGYQNLILQHYQHNKRIVSQCHPLSIHPHNLFHLHSPQCILLRFPIRILNAILSSPIQTT